MELKKRSFEPDVIVVHPGWGEHIFITDVWPRARVLLFLEFFYRTEGYDFAFDPELSRDTLQGRARLRVKNATLLTGFDVMDWGVSPTHWQKSSLPAASMTRSA